ncbi:MAG: aspartate-semialdehyde dehydrogenase [Planctomycetes bacterium]|nr:aspartate-semialdehyde dehydrogenase [Planctomycetota bacterium]
MRRYNIAIVGATGIVGLELLKILVERRFPVRELRLFASAGSAGKSMRYKGKGLKVNNITNNSFEGIDIAFFAVDGSISKKWAPVAVKSGAVVIDKSSAFRMGKNVPLVIPEINADAINTNSPLVRGGRGCVIASPNCSTTPLAMALKPLNDYAKVKRVVVSTYQSVSGAGLQAVQALTEQTKQVLNLKSKILNLKSQRYAFNAIPQIDSFCEDDYTGEEVKMINETRKILNDYSIKITATCVRIPVYCGHSESVNIETARPITVAQARNLLSRAKGIKVMDNPLKGSYPMPIDVAGKDEVFVGRIRKDRSVRNGINLWLVSDNLRKGAALNAVQIAEYLIKT